MPDNLEAILAAISGSINIPELNVEEAGQPRTDIVSHIENDMVDMIADATDQEFIKALEVMFVLRNSFSQ